MNDLFGEGQWSKHGDQLGAAVVVWAREDDSLVEGDVVNTERSKWIQDLLRWNQQGLLMR